MIAWIPSELHTHTINSDGELTLMELANKAEKFGIECIALTDHNTISGHLEIPYVMKETDMNIIHGLEWTTFYGHMVLLGIEDYVDWRDMGSKDIHKGIVNVHKMGGIVGIAHPFRMGSPMCTGCYWEFEVTDWNDIDYLEVWSEVFPPLNPANKRAFQLWTGLLDKGYRITAVSGRDWHGQGNGSEDIAVTYLGLNKDEDSSFEKKALDALTNGRACVSMGPLMIISADLKTKKNKFTMGEKIVLTNADSVVGIHAELDYKLWKGIEKLDNKQLTITLTSNRGVLFEKNIPYGFEYIEQSFQVEGLKWVRAELYGSIKGINTMVAFTNPLYFREL